MNELTHLSLFSGIGGLDLAAELAGFRTVGQCEWADYPRAVLEKHWPGLLRWRDIRTLTGYDFYAKTGLRTVDVISGGFPCQPFSTAGKRRGKDDDRYLWPEMLRVIRELWPTWVICENVPGLANLALDTVLSDLEAEGYEVQCFLIPACGVDAPHKRYRIVVVAHTLDRSRSLWGNRKFQDLAKNGGERFDYRGGAAESITGKRWENQPGTGGMAHGLRAEVYGACTDPQSIRREAGGAESVLDAQFTNCSSRERETVPEPAPRTSRTHAPWEDWPSEPGVGRVVDGVPYRVDRLKCLGNAVVPQQFYPIFRAIAEVERYG